MIHAGAPLETVPLYVRGGAIIPMGPEMNYVGEKATDLLTFEVYPDAQGNARAQLYEDDGVSPAYRNGVERRTTVTYQSSKIDVSAPAGSYQPGPRTMHFTVHPGDGRPHKVTMH
jgi:alpha-glucosidase (family GH31 glycosyl hydrolase)